MDPAAERLTNRLAPERIRGRTACAAGQVGSAATAGTAMLLDWDRRDYATGRLDDAFDPKFLRRLSAARRISQTAMGRPILMSADRVTSKPRCK
jgi:hypothetical protein